MRLLVDMNLSPQWVPALQRNGWPAAHWSTVGDPRAPDQDIFNWAREHEYVIVTHDLDFGTLLALTHAAGPSVLQLRTQDVLLQHLASLIRRVEAIATLQLASAEVRGGASG